LGISKRDMRRRSTLLAVDKSIWAYSAFNRAIEDVISKKKLGLETDLYILYVSKPTHVGTWLKSMVDLGAKTDSKPKQILSFCGKKSLEHEVIPILLRGSDSNPGVAIAHAAEEMGIERIFIGSHGGTKIKKIQLGSTSKHVAEKANCDVVIVKSVAEGVPTDIKEQIKSTNTDYLFLKEKSTDKQFVEYYFHRDFLGDKKNGKTRRHSSYFC